MTHSISTCASCKQITFINTSHTPRFFRMFCWWLVMEFQNPAPEAGRLLKTAQTLDKQTHFVWGLSPGACPRQEPAAAALGGAVGGSGSGGGRSDSPRWEFQPRSFSHRCPSAAAEWSPAQRKARAESLLFLQKPFDFCHESPNEPFQM